MQSKFSYTIHSHHIKDGDIMMQFNSNTNQKVEVNLSKDFPGYCCNGNVINTYYKINGNSNDIVRINPPFNSRVVILDGDNVYTRISQWELDRYECDDIHSDNGKIYNYLVSKFSK